MILERVQNSKQAKLSLSALRDLASNGEPKQISGQQELYENIYNIHLG